MPSNPKPRKRKGVKVFWLAVSMAYWTKREARDAAQKIGGIVVRKTTTISTPTTRRAKK
jgi:hypothetical protein